MYYTLEKAAEVLGVTPGDLNRLREAGKIRAFRDGSTWKFRKEDIDNYLAETIKKRSAEADPDSDLLNDSDEELPTMLADTNSFEKLSDVKIEAREQDDVFLDESVDRKGDPSSSGVSLIDDEDDVQLNSGSDSGISLLDDGFFENSSNSNIDLGGDDIVLGGNSGLDLSGDSGIMIGETPSSGSGSGISIIGGDEDDPFTLSPDLDGPEGLNMEDQEEKSTQLADGLGGTSSSSSTSTSEESDLYGLAPDPEEKKEDVFDLVSEENSFENAPDSHSTSTQELMLEGEEDFQLEPQESPDMSDSDSSSEVIPLEDDSLFKTDDGEMDLLGNPSQETTEAPAETENVPFDVAGEENFDTGGADGFGATSDFGGGDEFGAAGGFGGDEFGGASGFGGGDEFGGASGFGDVDGGGFSTGEDGSGVTADNFEGFGQNTSPNPDIQKQAPTKDFTGMSVGLGLVPCILVLILAGIGVYELVRVIWSWDQPFGLTGSILETIGGLLKLF